MKVLITGGIGDFIATESHWQQKFRDQITHITLGCLHNKEIQNLLLLCKPSFPNLEYVDFFYNEFPPPSKVHEKMPNITNILINKIRELTAQGILDYSLTNSFERICTERETYVGSSLLKNQLCSIEEFNLPDRYYFICPHSLKARSERQFCDKDWRTTLTLLKYNNVAGVVVTQDVLAVPYDDNLIVLRNKTTIAEACEMIKKAKGFIGIDSFSATLAAQLDLETYLVKSVNSRTYAWKKNIYFAPHKTFNFLNRNISLPRYML